MPKKVNELFGVRIIRAETKELIEEMKKEPSRYKIVKFGKTDINLVYDTKLPRMFWLTDEELEQLK
jgi:hypothetical protein